MNHETPSFETASTTYELLDQWVDDLGSSEPEIALRFTGIGNVSAGGLTGTFLVLIGGDIDTPNGTVAATLTFTSTSDATGEVAQKTTRPTGVQLVKIVGKISSAGKAHLRGGVVVDFAGSDANAMALTSSVVIA